MTNTQAIALLRASLERDVTLKERAALSAYPEYAELREALIIVVEIADRAEGER